MIEINGHEIEIKRFPDGSPNLMNVPAIDGDHVDLLWRYRDDEFHHFMLLAYHYRAIADTLEIWLPYLPNARMDRIKCDTEVATLRCFGTIISAIGADAVHVFDPHSEFSYEAMPNIEVDYGYDCLFHVLNSLIEEKTIIVLPDKGAMDKYEPMLIARKIKNPRVFCEKQRDWNTGHIIGLDVIGQIPENADHAVILDDICSKGTTILKTAEKLQLLGIRNVFALVSHADKSIYDGLLLKEGTPLTAIHCLDSIDRGNTDMIPSIPFIVHRKGE